jgi:2-polyprenyl-3-methyl-5-hydroxy-6-metoxy-1,4-benzoquinol methylase
MTTDLFDAASDAQSLTKEKGSTITCCPTCGSNHTAEFLSAPDRFHLRKKFYRLRRCGSCAGVWQSNPPTPEEMGDHYTREYHDAIVAAGEGSAASRWKEQVKLISRFKQRGSILDIGCSSGGFLSTMKREDWSLNGVEMEESTAEKARANTAANVFVGDVLTAPFSPGSFDVITCFDVIEHIYDPRQFLMRIREWLKPGGIFYSMTPNIESWEARVFKSYWFGLELPRHLTLLSPRSLRSLMRDIGLEELVVKTPRVSYIERSIGYVFSELLFKLGFSATPQARPSERGLALRLLRKSFRITLVGPISKISSLANAGPCLETIFAKSK